MRALPSVIVEAERVLAEGEDASAALRELLSWIGLQLNPAERERVKEMRGDPDRYVALPVVLSINPQAAGGITETPQGEIVFFQWLLTLPMRNLCASRVLGADGQVGNPAEGMLPLIEGRWVLPKGRVAPHVLRSMGLLPSISP